MQSEHFLGQPGFPDVLQTSDNDTLCSQFLSVWMTQFRPDWEKFSRSVHSGWTHQHLVLKKGGVPLLAGNGGNVHATGVLVLAYHIKEISVVIRDISWIWKAVFPHEMVSVRMLMKQAVSECWVNRSFQKGSDEESKTSSADMHQAKFTICCTPV